jgi:hypothetical protein
MRRELYQIFASALMSVCVLGTLAAAQTDAKPPVLKIKNYSPQKKVQITKEMVSAAVASQEAAGGATLPVWNYEVVSSRDGGLYDGVIVGQNPSDRSNASVTVPAQLIPIILKTHTVGTAINFKTGVITTAPGNTTFDPTAVDACLAAPNNVPVALLRQSPVLANADFNFGGTDVGTTQYVDAFQRANLWKVIDRKDYHVRLKPIVLAPIVIDVPKGFGLAVNPGVFNTCAPFGIVDINLLDLIVTNAFTQLAKKGVNPKTFPMFMLYNSGMSLGDPANLGNCCAGGYHSINPAGPLTFQTYSPFDFDTTGVFGTGAMDTGIVSHEVGEWVNDPYIINATPNWGHVGQVSGCQNNYEVGDPLTGNESSRIVMKNGYTYHLQELAFFSWFFGAPSIGLDGWYSNNGTFLTDAGPVCH